MVKTTELACLSYIWEMEATEEETNWLLDSKGVMLTDDKAEEALFYCYFTCQIEEGKTALRKTKKNPKQTKSKAQDRWNPFRRELCHSKWNQDLWLQQIISWGPTVLKNEAAIVLGASTVKKCAQRLEMGKSGPIFNEMTDSVNRGVWLGINLE